MVQESFTASGSYTNEKVVISGISGVFPDARNVRDLSDILYNKVNPVKPAEERWQFDHPDAPKYTGQIVDQESFDAHFFKISHRLCYYMDTMVRKVLENTYMALFDAGINPEYLKKKNIGVFCGSSLNEGENTVNYDHKSVTGFALLGAAKCMPSNRISYWLDTHGPSVHIDAGAASATVALAQAWAAISSGLCEGAIVATSQVNLHPHTIICSGREIKLSKDDRTRSFDKAADGCLYSDAITVMILQRECDALRVYAEISKVKCETVNYFYNYKDDTGNTSLIDNLTKFYNDFYKECDIAPSSIGFVEAVGSAQPLLDKAELEAIAEVYCKDRVDPVYVGSIMSNIGNTYAASGSCSIIKVLLGFRTGQLAANLHYETPREDVAAVREGRLRVATDHLHCRLDHVAVNSLSYSGAFGHMLLKRRYKDKDLSRFISSIPRLVLLSGRQEACVQNIIDNLCSRPIDAEEIALLNGMQRWNVSGHLSRGFAILDTKNESTEAVVSEVSYFDNAPRPLWFVYSGMGSQWTGMGVHLMRIPVFAGAIERCRKVLQPRGVDIVEILTSTDKTIFDNILNSFVGIAAIQIGLTDILRELNIVPDGIIGHSVGELGCGYADGCFTAEEMILSAYSRGLVSLQTPFIHGSMAAVGIGNHKIVKLLPPEIEVACHNSHDSCTISGPADNVKQFLQQLADKDIFAKEVPSSNIAYHSRYIAEAGPLLLKYLKEIIITPKCRSARWISTSVPQATWSNPEAKLCSAEYHTNNLLSPVLFEEALRLIPRDAVLVEIAPHGLLQAILKRALPPTSLNIPLTNRHSEDNALYLLEGIGKLFLSGVNPDVGVLYPKVEFPVSTSTPMLSHLVSWSYEEKWRIPLCIKPNEMTAAVCQLVISLLDEEYSYLKGFQSRGKFVFPFSAAIVAVWDTLAMCLHKRRHSVSVVFKDVHLLSQPILSSRNVTRFRVSINRGSGLFEVLQGDIKVIEGHILTETNTKQNVHSDKNDDIRSLPIASELVYQLLHEKELLYMDQFKIIHSTDYNINEARIKWNDNWVTFIDGLIQLNILKSKLDDVEPRPCFIKTMYIDVNEHVKILSGVEENSVLPAYADDLEDSVRCGGVSINNLKFMNWPLLDNQLQVRRTNSKGNINTGHTSATGVMLKSSRAGDIGSLHWTQAPTLAGAGVDVEVHYAAINAHDVKCATGVILTEKEELLTDRCYGMDFSGVTTSGVKVMGLVDGGAIRTAVRARDDLIWPVPTHWSLEDAATVPLAYSMAFYCLVIKHKIRPGMSVLVHGGAGALGQAAISIALAYDVQVYTTVSNVRKKKFLKKIFPQLKEENFGNSREITFEDVVLSRTSGNGCDVIVSCGKGQIKHSSMKCCSSYGMSLDTSPTQRCLDDTIGMNVLMRCRSYATVDITSIFKSENIVERKQLQRLISEGIAAGYVRPLTRLTYAPENVVNAFRLLAASQHLGRVLVDFKTSSLPASIKSRIECSPDLWSTIFFDEEVMGVKLAEWLVSRGARQLRFYPLHQTQPYFSYKIQKLQSKSDKIEIEVNSNISAFGYEQVASTERVLVVLNDIESSYRIAPVLRQLQVISSRSPQAPGCTFISYEGEISKHISKINEENNFKAVYVTLPNLQLRKVNISAAINIIEDVLSKSERTKNSVFVETEYKKHGSIFSEISALSGLDFSRDVKKYDTLFKLGLDEAKSQAVSALLLDKYNTSIPEQNIPDITIKLLDSFNDIKACEDSANGLDCLLSYSIADAVWADASPVCLPTLANKVDPTDVMLDYTKPFLIILPGLESLFTRFYELCESLKIAALVLQAKLDETNNTLKQQAQVFFREIEHIIKHHDRFYLLGYECGVPLALQLAALLEQNGKQGTVFCLGHGPDELRVELQKIQANVTKEMPIEEAMMRHIVQLTTGVAIDVPSDVLCFRPGWMKQLQPHIHAHLKKNKSSHTAKYIMFVMQRTFQHFVDAQKPFSLSEPLNSQIILLKSLPIGASTAVGPVGSIERFSRQAVVVYELETSLNTSVKDPRCAAIINSHLHQDVLEYYKNQNICEIYPVSDLIKFV